MQGYEQQERITKQALEREGIRINEMQRAVESQKVKTAQLCDKRYNSLLAIEDRERLIEDKLKQKAKLIRQKSEIQNLIKAVESNIAPTEFRNQMGLADFGSSEEEAPS